MAIRSCEFGRVNRMRVEKLEEGQVEILKSLKEIKDSNTNMFNHFTERYEQMFKETANRLPVWVLVMGSMGSALLGGLLIWALTH